MSGLTGKKVLLVDDDSFLASAFKTRLEENGIVLSMVHDGEQAIKSLKTETPDLIMLDLMMPHKDGFGVLKDLQKNPNWKDIPVVVVSNIGQQSDIDRVMKMGAKDFLIKSDVTLDDILQAITKQIG